MTDSFQVVVDLPIYRPGLEALKQIAGCEVVMIGPGDEDEPRFVDPDLIQNAEILLCSLPPSNVEVMHALQWIQISSSGYAQLIGLPLVERGIRATNSRGCSDITIAEWNIAMMIALVRNLRQMMRNQESQIWDRSAAFQGEVRGKIVGFWGYGGIGRETARLAQQMGMRVQVLSRSAVGPRELTYAVPGTGDPRGTVPERVFRSGEEAEFLRDLDFLIICVPLTAATTGLIGERELRALPPRAFLLNPARGSIVNEAALIRALAENWIAGAALDTHFQYPLPPTHPLWHLPNTILTPHISGSSLNPQFEHRLWDLFVQNVKRYTCGTPLLNELTSAQLSGA